ncbi:MAG: hypothetical protein M1829_006114 [Trizodia sp. TS-e1964]|nr:MAG: hypothetical protein M1829_006114 [Trizodia sp. TS-e1964]
MTAAPEETAVLYEDLAELEREFEDVDIDILRKQIVLNAPLYEKRQALISRINNFWPLVLEQSPLDIDQYIQPSDSALLLTHLLRLEVIRFEVAPYSTQISGDPRSVAFIFHFSENPWFSNTKLEKKFWYRRSADGWTGLVSEPIKIDWAQGKDLSSGITDAAYAAWNAAAKIGNSSRDSKDKSKISPEQTTLDNMISKLTQGSQSFFAWFGYVGRRVSAEESAKADSEDRERRGKAKHGLPSALNHNYPTTDEPIFESDEDVFPDGENLAIAIADDLFPGALKYFTQAQEQDMLSDVDFEESDDDEYQEDSVEESGEQDSGDLNRLIQNSKSDHRPFKKRKL